jgi:hypothetical protein
MNLYAIEVTIHATAYVKARTPGEACRRFRQRLEGQTVELPENCLPTPFSNAKFEDPALPLASLSPVLTIGAITSCGEPELVASDIPASRKVIAT